MAGLASEQALDAARGELLTAAATMDDSALDSVGQDLAAVAAVVAGDIRLRRFLTESTVAAEAKAGLVDRLLRGQVSERSLALVKGFAGQRWTTGRALVDGFRQLSRTAFFLQAERSGELDEVEDQLFRFERIVDAQPELAAVLDDANGSPDGRVDLIGRLLAGKAHRLTIRLLSDLARDTRGRNFAHGVATLVQQAAARRDKLVAIVSSAIPLDNDQVEQLRDRLAAVYARDVAVHVRVQPTLGGGLQVRVGDEVIDGSVSGRLDTLRRQLTH